MRLGGWLLACSLAALGCTAAPEGPSGPSLSDSYGTLPGHAGEPTPSVPLVGPALFEEGFERGLDGWTIAGDMAGVSWHRLNAYSCGGAWVMLFGLLGEQPFSTGEATLTRAAPLSLAGASRPHLIYDVMGRATPEGALTIQPEARRPGGAWQPVGAVAPARYDFGYTRFADLSPYAGGPVELRFHARASGLAAPAVGLYLDQIKVIVPKDQTAERVE